MDEPEPIEYPITDELDLHTFRPDEVKELLVDYLDECAKRGLTSVRIAHGKGTGALRELVHAQLRKNPRVAGFRVGREGEGGWGATVVEVKSDT